GIPVETVERMRTALKEFGKTAEIIVYPNTPHAFFADYRPSYRKEQAEDGWKRMLDWFKKNGGAGIHVNMHRNIGPAGLVVGPGVGGAGWRVGAERGGGRGFFAAALQAVGDRWGAGDPGLHPGLDSCGPPGGWTASDAGVGLSMRRTPGGS